MSENTQSPIDHRLAAIEELAQARQAGGGLFWFSAVLAVIWWGCAIAGAVSWVGLDEIKTFPPASMAAGAFAITLPGLVLLMSGLLAREQRRSSAANAIVLEAATKLLLPAELTSAGANDLAQSVVKASSDVDKAVAQALSGMKAVADELGDERQRLESVSYAAADNARDLADRLVRERNALETLTQDLRTQSETLGQAIPKQAAMIVESAKAAAEEVAASETSLEIRLGRLDETSKNLVSRIHALDSISEQAGLRNERVEAAISSMEDKLEKSRQTVETAVKAGELATTAAAQTSTKILASISNVIENARDASDDLDQQQRATMASTMHSLQQLKETGDQAAAAVKAAGVAARAEIDLADRRAAQTGERLLTSSSRVKESPIERPAPPPPIAPEPPVSNGALHASEPEPTDTVDLPPIHRSRAVESPSRAVEEDLFEASADRIAQAFNAMQADEDVTDPEPTPPQPAQSEPLLLKTPLHTPIETDLEMFDDVETHPINAIDAPNVRRVIDDESRRASPEASPPLPDPNTPLSEIIADMQREDGAPLSREDTASALLRKLEDSGVRLGEIFRPKDKKKVAMAARKGEKQRRMATRSQAGRQVERVKGRVRSDYDLAQLARDFVALETADALNALENTYASSKNASPRLAAFILLDAALD